MIFLLFIYLRYKNIVNSKYYQVSLGSNLKKTTVNVSNIKITIQAKETNSRSVLIFKMLTILFHLQASSILY